MNSVIPEDQDLRVKLDLLANSELEEENLDLEVLWDLTVCLDARENLAGTERWAQLARAVMLVLRDPQDPLVLTDYPVILKKVIEETMVMLDMLEKQEYQDIREPAEHQENRVPLDSIFKDLQERKEDQEEMGIREYLVTSVTMVLPDLRDSLALVWKRSVLRVRWDMLDFRVRMAELDSTEFQAVLEFQDLKVTTVDTVQMDCPVSREMQELMEQMVILDRQGLTVTSARAD